ncbi:cotton fiber protein [Rhynchospora pubera]|uniref:Cotton fiber protein n=1 Tax=Rhynchospora pubera TaxID=906938 RepID=A0AAV8F193_9POAL|nr:cotton fiber protein [Rhynchospora pubera]
MLDTWQTITSFLTPTTLFLLLNLVIATIVLSSRHHHNRCDPESPSAASFAGAYHFPLLRTTSPVLERLRSFTLHRFRSGDLPTDTLASSPTSIPNPNPIPTESDPNSTSVGFEATFREVAAAPSPAPLARTSSILDRLKSINLYRFRSGEIQTEEVKIETTTAVIATSSSENHFGRSQSESSRPVVKKKKTKKTKKTVSVGGVGDGEEVEVRQRRSFRDRDVVVEEEVDARADDFINRFKEQLKIQRLNSILNYKDMLNRGR